MTIRLASAFDNRLRSSVRYLSDESGFAVDSPRTHGYSKRGARCYGVSNWQARGRVNAIGICMNNTLIQVVLFEGTINSDVFFEWVNSCLLSVLPNQCVVVLDNASFHKRQDIQSAIVKAGHTLEFLPTYSPDLNPIEHKWAQAKSIRKKYRCDVQTLFQ